MFPLIVLNWFVCDKKVNGTFKGLVYIYIHIVIGIYKLFMTKPAVL